MLRVAVPNKGTLSEPAAEILSEAGYRRRTDSRDLTVLDPANDVEFFFLRPKDIAIYVGSGELDLGITGRDLAADSGAPVDERLALGFGRSTFRYAAPAGKDWTVDDLAGKRIATAYPNLVRADLAAHGIAGRRSSGSTARWRSRSSSASPTRSPTSSAPVARWASTTWSPSATSLCDSEAVLIERRGADQRRQRPATSWPARVQGVVFAPAVPDAGLRLPALAAGRAPPPITPGLESPTVAPLADPAWVAVRAMVPRNELNPVMDRLADLGAKAILASDIRSCRAF